MQPIASLRAPFGDELREIYFSLHYSISLNRFHEQIQPGNAEKNKKTTPLSIEVVFFCLSLIREKSFSFSPLGSPALLLGRWPEVCPPVAHSHKYPAADDVADGSGHHVLP